MGSTREDVAVPFQKFLEVVEAAAVSVGPADSANNVLMQAQTALEVNFSWALCLHLLIKFQTISNYPILVLLSLGRHHACMQSCLSRT